MDGKALIMEVQKIIEDRIGENSSRVKAIQESGKKLVICQENSNSLWGEFRPTNQ